MDWATISGGFSDLTELLTKAYTVITTNAVLLVVLCGGLVGIGFRIFRKAKKACK